MKVVAIGAGGHAALTHGPAWAEIARNEPELELAAVCDIRADRAAEYAREFGYRRVYTNYVEMLETEKPDGATLVTPASETPRLGSELLRRGIPLLMEKPPGRNELEYAQLLQAYREHRTPHLIAFNRRHMPLLEQARDLWKGLVPAGETLNIRCDFYRYSRHDADFSTTAIHGIDLAAFLAEAAYRDVKINLQRSGKGETVTISLWSEFTNGICAQLLFCPLSGSSFERLHLTSEQYAMTVELPVLGCCDIPGRIVLHHRGGIEREIPAAENPLNAHAFYLGGFYHENLAFIEMLRQRKTNADLENVASVVQVTEAVGKAIAAGTARQWSAVPPPALCNQRNS